MSDTAALVRGLRSPRRLEQRAAAQRLHQAILSGSADYERLVAAGCASLLLEQVRSGPSTVQDAAATALGSLVHESGAARDRAAAAGGLELLAERPSADGTSPEVLTSVAYALAALIGERVDLRAPLAAAPGALPRLVQLLEGSAGNDAVEYSADVLRLLASSGMLPEPAQARVPHASRTVSAAAFRGRNDSVAATVVAAGAAPAVAAALLRTGLTAGAQVSACGLASNLGLCGQSAALLAAGIEPRLQQLAGSSSPAVQQSARLHFTTSTPACAPQQPTDREAFTSG